MDSFLVISKIIECINSEKCLNDTLRLIANLTKQYLNASGIRCIPGKENSLFKAFQIPQHVTLANTTFNTYELKVQKNKNLFAKYTFFFPKNADLSKSQRINMSSFLKTLKGLLLLLFNEIETKNKLKLTESAIDAALSSNTQLLPEMNLENVLKSLLITAINLIPVDLAHIFLYNNKRLTFGAAMGPDGFWDKPYSKPRKHGVTYRVARTGEPLIIPDIKKSELFKNSPANWEGSIVSIPLKVGQRVVGVMNMSKFEPGAFPEEAIRIWKLFSKQAAVAIENARLAEKERKHISQLRALRTSIATINSSLDISEVFDKILNEIRKVIPYDSASIMLIDGDFVQVLAGKDLPDKNAIGKRYRISELERRIARKLEPIILSDARRNKHFGKWGNTDYVRGWMGIPMISQKGVIGYITLDSRKYNAFTKADAQLALSFAHHAAIAVRNAMLHTSLKNKIKALKEYQTKLVTSEKLASIGKLVAGIAHELNNPLASIMGIAQLLKMEDLGEEQCGLVETLIRETTRSANIVKNLLDFAKQQKPQKRVIDLGEILEKVAEEYKKKEKAKNINIVFSKPSETLNIQGDPYKLEQVFINIINNALDAIEETDHPGIIKIHIDKHPPSYSVEEYSAENTDEIEDRHGLIRVTIEDNGPGIPEDTLPHIFDPFYTTKPAGKGTGLGLSVTHGIISEHGGNIWAENPESGGARFVIELPTEHSKKDSISNVTNESESASTEKEQKTKKKILIIEDEETLRIIIERFLSKKGFTTISFGNGYEAMEKINNTEKGSIGFIICDLKMPGLSGIEIYHTIKREYPELEKHFLVITGDTVSKEYRQFIESQHLAYLAKPFEMSDLVKKIESMMEN